MAVAEALCAQRGQRLTPIRRKVLAALLGTHKPLGAYEIIERLALTGPRLAPITTYRALEFLRENGLVHRIESRNAFVACVHNHAASALVVFLICERCGAVGEASSEQVSAKLTSALRRNRR
jgi:Fur family transcriptional regulator, zinc uptake regulator